MRKIFEYFKYDIWRVMKPEAYHGAGKSGPYFEGWYYKLVSSDGSSRISIIPGIYKGAQDSDSHSFIQIIDGVRGKSRYIKYPHSEFSFRKGLLDITVGKSNFRDDQINLDVSEDNFSIVGKLSFDSLTPWSVRLFSPGIMGWYAWVPGMECYHGVVSMDHTIIGALKYDSELVDFSGGKGYIEKDWGQSMPKAWIWMQSNHFEEQNISLTASIADIPFGSFSFNGFIAGFLYKGHLYLFATYTGAELKDFQITEKHVRFSMQDKHHRLAIYGKRSQGSSLQAPTTRQMDRRIMETLSAQIEVELIRMDTSELIYQGTGKFAGLEVVGELKIG